MIPKAGDKVTLDLFLGGNKSRAAYRDAVHGWGKRFAPVLLCSSPAIARTS